MMSLHPSTAVNHHSSQSDRVVVLVPLVLGRWKPQRHHGKHSLGVFRQILLSLSRVLLRYVYISNCRRVFICRSHPSQRWTDMKAEVLYLLNRQHIHFILNVYFIFPWYLDPITDYNLKSNELLSVLYIVFRLWKLHQANLSAGKVNGILLFRHFSLGLFIPLILEDRWTVGPIIISYLPLSPMFTGQ